MTKFFNHANKFVLTLSAVSLVIASQSAQAEIYKWRDTAGRVKYSDRPPVEGFTKASPQEIINALQAKDLCAVPANVNATKTVSEYKANFFGFGTAATNQRAFNQPASIFGIGAVAAPKTVAARNNPFALARPASQPVAVKSRAPKSAAYSPLNATSFFNLGNRPVTVFGSPIKAAAIKQASLPFSIIPAAQAAPKPAATPVATSSPAAQTPTSPAPATAPTAQTPTSSAPTTPDGPPPTTTSSNLIQVGFMPAVDISKQPLPAVGASNLRVHPTKEVSPSKPPPAGGEFRIQCRFSHMSNDDPLVYPNQQGAAHHHTFFGNTAINYKTNLDAISTTGNSTCNGGIMNRSGYWTPSVIDNVTHTPIAPSNIIVYYKTGRPDDVVVPPKGLRMIAGNAKSTTAQLEHVRYTCNQDYATHKTNMPSCAQGGTMEIMLTFPSCWDGANLDSPDHKSHMARGIAGLGCPATHPVRIPDITYNLHYKVNTVGGTANWRLASDNYAGGVGGNSMHGDWVNGWDEKFSKIFTVNCLQARRDCHAHLLGDGTMFTGG